MVGACVVGVGFRVILRRKVFLETFGNSINCVVVVGGGVVTGVVVTGGLVILFRFFKTIRVEFRFWKSGAGRSTWIMSKDGYFRNYSIRPMRSFANLVRSYVQHQTINSLRASFVHVCIPISINRLSAREVLSEAVQKRISVLKHKCGWGPMTLNQEKL